MNILQKGVVTVFVLGTLMVPSVAFAVDITGTPTKRPLRDVVKAAIQKKFPRAALGTGKVTGMNGSVLTVEKDGKSFTVHTGTFEKCTTKIARRFGGVSNLSEVGVGHIITVVGRFTDDAKTTVEACHIRDTSIQKRFGVFVGYVTSVTSNGFVMTTVSAKRENQTVTVSSATKFVNRKEESIGQSDIVVGHKIRVKGVWDRSNNSVTEVAHVKDFTVPLQEKK